MRITFSLLYPEMFERKTESGDNHVRILLKTVHRKYQINSPKSIKIDDLPRKEYNFQKHHARKPFQECVKHTYTKKCMGTNKQLFCLIM